jgi:hypothetical protein
VLLEDDGMGPVACNCYWLLLSVQLSHTGHGHLLSRTAKQQPLSAAAMKWFHGFDLHAAAALRPTAAAIPLL